MLVVAVPRVKTMFSPLNTAVMAPVAVPPKT